MAYYLKDLPFTEEGKKLKLSDEDRERFRLVYKREGDGWILHDIYEKGGEYGDDCIVVPLQSAYTGWINIDQGSCFANAKGTSCDPKPENVSASWLGLWTCMYLATHTNTNQPQPPKICSADGNTYSPDGPQYGFCTPQNPRNLEGAHIISGMRARYPEKSDFVYIVPLCSRHNHVNAGGRDDIYMMTWNRETFAVRLLGVVTVYDYLAQHPLETHEKI